LFVKEKRVAYTTRSSN